jgi:hypothetical protein
VREIPRAERIEGVSPKEQDEDGSHPPGDDRRAAAVLAAHAKAEGECLAAQLRNNSVSLRTLEPKQPFGFVHQNGRTLMTSHAVEGACAFAWRTYLLLHKGIDENDDRRTALHRYVTSLCDAGERDFDVLQVAAQLYLKKLDELHEDEKARLAASEAMGRRSFEIGD